MSDQKSPANKKFVFISYAGNGFWKLHDPPGGTVFLGNLVDAAKELEDFGAQIKKIVDIVGSVVGFITGGVGLYHALEGLLGFGKADTELAQIDRLMAGYVNHLAELIATADSNRLMAECARLNGTIGAASAVLTQRFSELASQANHADPLPAPLYRIGYDVLEEQVINPVVEVLETLLDPTMAFFRCEQPAPPDAHMFVSASGTGCPDKIGSRFDYRFGLPVLMRAVNVFVAAIAARDPGFRLTGGTAQGLVDRLFRPLVRPG